MGRIYRHLRSVSVGLITRTEIDRTIPCKELPCRLQATWGG
jgi:hypothetical protein